MKTFALLSSGRLRLSLSATLVFILFATASAVFAEARSIPACVLGNPNARGETALQFGAYESKTENNLSGCTHLFVRLREWLAATMTTEVYRTNSTGAATTGWASISAKSGRVYVAKNTVQRRIDGQLPSALVYVFTSDNGTHSNGSWWCTGTSGGSSSCGPTP